MRVIADPVIQMTDAQRRRHFEIAIDLHELQRRGMSVTTALDPFYAQMTDVAGKIGAMQNVPADVKAQFESLNKELDVVRAKFGVPIPPGGFGSGGRGGRGGFGGGGGNDGNVVNRVGQVKTQVMAFNEVPSDALVRRYNTVKTELTRAITEANNMLVKAMGVGQALKPHGVALTVPAPIK